MTNAPKVMGLSYPGGPVIDRLAKEGNPERFTFNKPNIPGLDYSFSGLKTSFLYFIRDEIKTIRISYNITSMIYVPRCKKRSLISSWPN